jgi:hypothetical protein
MESINDYISTKQASELFGLTQRHISHLIRKDIVKGRKVGHDWLVHLPSLKKYAASDPRPGIKPGAKLWWRKRKTKS